MVQLKIVTTSSVICRNRIGTHKLTILKFSVLGDSYILRGEILVRFLEKIDKCN